MANVWKWPLETSAGLKSTWMAFFTYECSPINVVTWNESKSSLSLLAQMSADSPHYLLSFWLIIFLSLSEVVILLWGLCLQKPKDYTNSNNLIPNTPGSKGKIIRVCSIGFSSTGSAGIRWVLSWREEVGRILISSQGVIYQTQLF